MKKSNFLSLLKNKNFTLFSIGQTISQFGDKLDHMALIALLRVYAEGSTLAFSNLALFFTLPVIIFGPISGVFVDWWDRKKLLIFCDFARGFLVLGIPLWVSLVKNIWPVYIVVFFVFLSGLFFNSSKMAILPGLVEDKNQLLAANSLNNFIGRFATVFGMLVGGLVVDWGLWKKIGIKGYEAGFYIDALTYFFSATMIAFIKLPLSERKNSIPDTGAIIEKERNFFKQAWKDIIDALKLITRDKNVSFVLYSVFVLVFLGASVYVLIVIFVQQILGFGTTGVGKLGAITALGMITGAFVFGTFGEKWNRKNVILLGFAVISFLLFLFPFLPRFFLLGLCAFTGGIILSPILISQDTLLHETVPTFFRGRIFSTKELILNGSFLLIAYIMGLSAEIFKPKTMLVASSIILILLTLTAFFRTKNKK